MAGYKIPGEVGASGGVLGLGAEKSIVMSLLQLLANVTVSKNIRIIAYAVECIR